MSRTKFLLPLLLFTAGTAFAGPAVKTVALSPSSAPGSLAHERPAITAHARAEFQQEKEYHAARIQRGNKNKKEVALTFDDGPHETYTLELLKVLQKYHAPATFFVVGRQVEKFPTLIQMEVAQGHEIGIHTYDHFNLSELPPDMIGYELDECDRMIQKNIGAPVRFFRPPGGDRDPDVEREAAKRGYVMVLWTDDPGDYGYLNRKVILQRTLDRLENGAIILLHDGMPETIAAMPELITEIRKRGYQLVSMSQLAKDL